jgi:RNA polymerase sigma factor (sigma-70 family)
MKKEAHSKQLSKDKKGSKNIIYSDDVVLVKFVNYMQKALLHKRLNYIRDNKKIKEIECSLDELDNKLHYKEEINLEFFGFLSEKEQKVLQLHLKEKLTYQEISKILNLKPESIRKIQYRALKKIESRWEHNANQNTIS